MARAGGGKVVPSGRISVPVRPQSCRRRTTTRKISTTSADSGYSLCSTDSEDQVLVINKGLDRCAALLQDILHCETRDKATKPPKATFPRAHCKSSVKVKKNAVKKPTTASHVHREKVIVRKLAPSGGCNNVKGEGPPVTASSPALPVANCDLIQTQMQLLNRAACNAASAPAPESAVMFNYRLPTSTPTLSPQQPANPPDAGYGVYYQSLPLGGAAPFPSVSSAALTHSVPPAACNVQAPVQQTSNSSSYQPTRQADLLLQSTNYINQIRDSDLLQCVAAHLAQLGSQEATNAPEPEKERLLTETEEVSSDEEEEVMVDKAMARNISCQTSFSNQKKSSPEKTERKIRTVKYLLGEIKALVADRDDGEALRLVTELEHNVSLLPAVVGSTNVHAEIALALQPLRSDNAQLRRRLRILNQQLRDRERTARSEEQSYEVTSLQSMNETLQQQLMESQKSLESQQNKNQELLKVVETQKEENKTLSQVIQEKEREILQILQQKDVTSSRLKTESEDAVGNMKSLQFRLESAEKENQILGITLRQRDVEVARLRELTRTLQASMAKLLCDLGKDTPKARPGAPLTQAALDSYEKQLRTDQCPASSSIISYLKRLEMDHVIPGCSDRPDLAASTYQKELTSDPSDDFIINYQRPEPTVSSIPSHSPQKLRPEVNSRSCSLIGDEYKPDETTYLPMASSPHKANFAPSARLMCTPPKICSAERDIGEKINVFAASEGNRPIQRSLFNVPDMAGKTTKTQNLDVTKPKELSGGHPPLLHHLSNLRITDSRLNDHSAFNVMSAASDWSIASFSTFTSHDEQDFRNGLASLDANIAKLQRTLQTANHK
ncbi:coiled-coil domain-containing protein 14 [Aquarana catesbeiana]|uniref:coiled-coil domain-containing protein 14 n=1 Tax=Aquarana catesbeiana TaxID=8400 RepID=UPI003CC9F1B5